MATPSDVRRILQEIVGDLGPATRDQPAPTLLDKLATMRKRTEMGRPPGPETFRGNSMEDPTTWLSRMEDYLALQGYQNDQEKLRVIKMFLADRALIWFEGLNADQKRSVQTFKQAFQNKYQAPEARYAAAQALVDRKQGPDEDPENYITDVVLKGHMLGWDNARIQQQLINGLNTRYKPQVIMARPADLDEACSVIMTARHAVSHQTKELEGIQSALRELSSNIKNVNEERKTLRPPAMNPMAADEPRQKKFKKRSGFRPVVPIVISDNRPKPQEYGSPRPPRPDRDYRSGGNRGNDTCWTCGSPDHYASSCPQMMQGNVACFRCGIIGHISRLCPMNNNFQRRAGPGRGRGRGRPFPANQGN